MRWLPLLVILGCSSGAKHDDGAAAQPSIRTTAPEVAPAPATTAMPKVYLPTAQGEAAVSVEIVKTRAQIERGLMFREHLPPDQGMLFLMEDERVQSFWMKNTLIPLDLIFIAKDLTIAGVVENAVPRSEEPRDVGKPSSFVLEVNGGYWASHKVAAGGKVRFDNVPPR